MNKFDIIAYDFNRNDGLVAVTLKPKPQNQEKIATNIREQEKKDLKLPLLKEKYRCLKTDIQSLKSLLKRPYNIKEFKEFYRIYGQKLVDIDFGRIELFNLKGKNQFSIDEISQFRRDQSFVRWGKIFQIGQLQTKSSQQVQEQIVGLQFYNMLVRERLFTFRTLKYYKNDQERKKFPYQFLYTYDLEDCLQFNLQSFQEQASSQIKCQEYLPILKINFFQKYYDNFQLENIIVPFFQLKYDEQQYLQLFFVHLSKNGYKFKKQWIDKKESPDFDENKKYKCYIFVNYDTTFYTQPQLYNGVAEFASFHNFNIQQTDVAFGNIQRQQSKNFLEFYVDYIETEFFLSTISLEQKLNDIFSVLPQELSQKPFNDIIDERFMIPGNIQKIMQELFGK
ncbi:unnamed protein product [Paramecium sonneborni]|uniref:Uncharacterized protein n=1 Tax=Paramecium sonneborni TaxID=65129 RepID=A0A8S1LQC5_9CILI|nr:unnamed protein product [Paramecium sonneborni]